MRKRWIRPGGLKHDRLFQSRERRATVYSPARRRAQKVQKRLLKICAWKN